MNRARRSTQGIRPYCQCFFLTLIRISLTFSCASCMIKLTICLICAIVYSDEESKDFYAVKIWFLRDSPYFFLSDKNVYWSFFACLHCFVNVKIVDEQKCPQKCIDYGFIDTASSRHAQRGASRARRASSSFPYKKSADRVL